jgi:hypothetical protein
VLIRPIQTENKEIFLSSSEGGGGNASQEETKTPIT